MTSSDRPNPDVRFDYLGHNRERMMVKHTRGDGMIAGYKDEYDMPTRVGHVIRNFTGRKEMIPVVTVDEGALQRLRMEKIQDAIRDLGVSL